jgi:hypothetical protein
MVSFVESDTFCRFAAKDFLRFFFCVYDSFHVYFDEIHIITVDILFKSCGNEIQKHCKSGDLE